MNGEGSNESSQSPGNCGASCSGAPLRRLRRGQPTPAVELKVGDKAPNFKLQGSDGKTYSLADFAGKKAVVIAWFPAAFTKGLHRRVQVAGDER